jgi:uncharacterized membrane protein
LGKGRLEVFGDGVIAVIMTIRVLELRVPRGESLEALPPLLPAFLVYMLSYVYVRPAHRCRLRRLNLP